MDTVQDQVVKREESEPQRRGRKCACPRCTAEVYDGSFEYPYCPQCYVECN